jgi:formylglycine-generating enzyme required for sulfatase activity/uncharacterized caspase-like protein
MSMRTRRSLARLAPILAAWLLAFLPDALLAQERVALVIGNGKYAHARVLSNPVHDATDMAAALGKIGYRVQLVTDTSKAGMEAALKQFRRAATGADQAMIYYSGHGIEVGGVNYLLPVEASLESETDVPLEAVSLSEVMGVASRARRLALVVLDACRDNPLANSMPRVNGAKGVGMGLATPNPTGNELVAFATRDGQTSSDGTGRNSPYTKAILDTLQEPGLEVRLFWGRVHDRVMSSTRPPQEPFIYGSLGGEQLYLNPPVPAATTPVPGAPSAEVLLWQSVERLRTAEAYRAYIAQYPTGQFSSIAKLQLAALTRPASGGSSSSSHASALPATSPVSSTFRDCPECPEMAPIRAGDFLMGSPETEPGHSDDEGPQHKVHISAFEVSRSPVTRGQWRLYANDTGHRTTKDCDWLKPGFPQDDKHPVVCVNWQEAQDYIAWLNRKSGRHFRLLTEAEYEYVNRAGTQTAYFWSNSDNDLWLYANMNGKGTTPVESFKPNPWGLFDTTGNVWSWTQDCWHKSYNGAPTDGSARDTGCDVSFRVIRGGSWSSDTWYLRSANHSSTPGGGRDVGLRLARTTS